LFVTIVYEFTSLTFTRAEVLPRLFIQRALSSPTTILTLTRQQIDLTVATPEATHTITLHQAIHIRRTRPIIQTAHVRTAQRHLAATTREIRGAHAPEAVVLKEAGGSVPAGIALAWIRPAHLAETPTELRRQALTLEVSAAHCRIGSVASAITQVHTGGIVDTGIV
jgi:hypothetical protein